MSDGTIPTPTANPAASDTRPASHPITMTAAPDFAGLAPPGYEIVRELGRGGMGVVYLARHAALGRHVALKMILAGGHASPADLTRFQREAEAAAKLQHPNVVQVYEVGRHDGRPYFTLEYVDGGSLTAHARDPLPPREAAGIVEQVARGVAFAHASGIVHRDLKPDNVLFTQDRTPKVTDFGLAKSIDADSSLTATGAVMGTPSYMAPEQALGTIRVGPAADVYALGAILYRLLTGRPPFAAPTPHETIRQVIVADPAPPSQLVPKLPKDLVTICLKCLRKNPSQRYPSADDLADDLRRYLAGEPIHARPVGSPERAWKWVMRNRGPTVSAAVVFLALAAGAGVAAWQAVAARAAETIARDREQKETEAKELAQRRLAQVERGNQLLAAVFRDLDPDAAGPDARPLRAVLGDRLADAARQLEGESVGEAQDVARLQIILGNALVGLGYPDRAAPMLEKALRTIEAELAPDHPAAVRNRNTLAQAYHALGNSNKAIALFEQNAALLEAKLGPAHEDTLDARNNLAVTYRAAGRAEDAVRIHEETLKATEAAKGPNDPATLASRVNLAMAYEDVGRADDALKLYEAAVPGLETARGPGHLDTLAARNNLAFAYLARDRAADAARLYEANVKHAAAEHGADHPDTVKAQSDLGNAYRLAGRPADAARVGERALAAREKKPGPDHADTVMTRYNVALAYHDQGRYPDAIRLHEANLKYVGAGENLAAATAIRHDLGRSYLAAARPADAEPVLRACLAAREKARPDGWATADARSLLGEALLRLDKTADAEPLLRKGYEGLKAQSDAIPPAARGPRLREAADRLARLYEATDKADEAKKWRAEAAKHR